MERNEWAATMPNNMWEKICDDVDASTEAGFTFFQFVDFFSTNRHGLAQLHAGVYGVNLDSVAKRVDWAPELFDELEYRPGSRVRLHGLTSEAAQCYNDLVGTVMGLQRHKERYVVQLDPKGEVPHEGEEVKHLSLKPSNLAKSSFMREGFRSAHWSTMRVLRPAPPPIDTALTDEEICALSVKELRALVEPHARVVEELRGIEKAELQQRLVGLRDVAVAMAEEKRLARERAHIIDQRAAEERALQDEKKEKALAKKAALQEAKAAGAGGQTEVEATPGYINSAIKPRKPLDHEELTDERIQSMSAREIKKLLVNHGGSVGLAEKSDLVERLKEKRDEAAAQARAKETPDHCPES